MWHSVAPHFHLRHYGRATYGAILILCLYALPGGVAGLFRRARNRVRPRVEARVAKAKPEETKHAA